MTDDGRILPDDRLARDIEALLAVDPSPDFRVRVRTALGTDSARATWWRQPWLASSAFAAVTLLVVVALWPWSDAGHRVVPATPGSGVARVMSDEPDSQASGLATPRGVPTDDRTARGPIAATTTAGFVVHARDPVNTSSRVLVLPDVILAEDEVLGLKLLMLPPPVDDGSGPEIEPAARLAEIELRDIMLEPLALSARLEEELP